MMRFFIHIVIVLLILSCLQGCEEVYELDEVYEPKLVVNGLFQSGALWEIRLQKTYNILDNRQVATYVDDADVAIYDSDDNRLYQLVYDQEKKIYTHATAVPEAGKWYVLKVKHNAYDNLEAKGYCPMIPEVSFGKIMEVEEDGRVGINIEFDIARSTYEDNYYMWDVTTIEKSIVSFDSLTDFQNQPDYVLSNSGINSSGNTDDKISIDPSSYFFDYQTDGFQSNSTNDLDKSELHLNKNTDENDVQVFFTGSSLNGRGNGGEEDSPYRYNLHILSLSYELYNYYASIIDYGQQNHVNTSLHSSHKLKSNVEGGYGIFAGINRHTFAFK